MGSKFHKKNRSQKNPESKFKKNQNLDRKKNPESKFQKKQKILESKVQKKRTQTLEQVFSYRFYCIFLLKCCLFDTKIYIYDLENSLQTYRFLHKKTAYPQKMIEKYICMKVVQGLSFFLNLDFFLGIRFFFSFFIFPMFFF